MSTLPTVPLQLTAIFECQSFNTTIFCANTPWPRRLQPAAICVYIIRFGAYCLWKSKLGAWFLPQSQGRFVTFYPITSCLWFVLFHIQIRRCVQSALQILSGILCVLILKINLSNGSRAAKYDWRTSLQVHEPTLQQWHSRGLMCETFACETLPFQKCPALQLPCSFFLKIQVRFCCKVKL